MEIPSSVPAFEEIPSSVPSFKEIPSPSPISLLEVTPSEAPVSLFAADFWTREAFGLEAPEGGFGEDFPEPPPPGSTAAAPAKRRRRRRGRRVAPRAEAAAPA
jgi:hypothetical protein